MGQALYRKHRPKKLSEVVGQEHVTRTLEQALKQGRISHAYLFTGPRGVGKTSVARILAHEVNGFDYADDRQHLDIIEIDAASNRRIDEIRELRDKVYMAPTSGKYKVYIIDEVHMLTKEAFNALLKTLEEPPAHVVFVLATTEAHKLPETIISRTQRFSFKPGETRKIIEHLRSIAKQEKIDVTDDALKLIAEHSEGSFRDSVSLLDQAGNRTSQVELNDTQALLGIPPVKSVEKLAGLLINPVSNSISEILNTLENLYDQGYQAPVIAKQLSQHLRKQLVDRNLTIEPSRALELLASLIEVPASRDPARYLEIVLLEVLPQIDGSRQPTAQKMSSASKEKNDSATVPASDEVSKASAPTPATKHPAKADQAVKPKAENIDKKAKHSGKAIDETAWSRILAELKKKNNAIYGLARMAEPTFSKDGKITLAFAFAFHYKRLNDTRNYRLLVETIQEVTGHPATVTPVHDANLQPPAASARAEAPDIAPAAEPQNAELNTISNIFGGGELIES
jgi:DNA polymerase III subunit gamma/tau